MNNIRVIDFIEKGPVLEYSTAYLSEKLLELVNLLETRRNEYLNKIKSNLTDLDDAVLAMAALTSKTELEGKYSDIQDYLNHVVNLSTKIETIYTYLSNFNNLKDRPGVTTWIKLSVEQAKEFGL